MNTEANAKTEGPPSHKHGKDACEYTDGWDDALLKVRDEFPPENAEVDARRDKTPNHL